MEQVCGIQDMWNKVEKILKKKRLTTYRLSKMTKIPKTTIDNYHYGNSKMSFENACKIADALGVSLDELRRDKDESNTRR